MKRISLLIIIICLGLIPGADCEVVYGSVVPGFNIQHHKDHSHSEKSVPLFKGMGNHHHKITTKSMLAQRYFDQGLTLLYAFNHKEAIRSFREVARLDPECAIAYWGVALSLGPNINATMTEDAVPEAYEALQKALSLADKASEKERAYINALAKRYSQRPVENRKQLDVDYANAMREVARRYPSDSDAATLFAEALMNTMPWDYWTKDGQAKPETRELLAVLESALKLDPKNPGANHYYIHAVEASPNPALGLAAADRLRDLVPGAGHLVHMPGHIYLRVGRYHDASIANERAIEADKSYATQCHATGMYQVAYVPHNHHFLWASATMEGRSQKALEAARYMAAHVDHKLMREPGYGTVQHYFITPLYAMVRFCMWDEILSEPAPPADLLYPTAIWHYAQGTALAAKGRSDEAAAHLEKLAKIAEDSSLEKVTIWDINTSQSLVRIAREALAGHIAESNGDYANAIRYFQAAVEFQDKLNYDEPPPWHYPVRHSLGAALLGANRAKDAETVYREDLKRNPENGWSLYGLLLSLKAQGDKKGASEVKERFKKAWAYADIKLSDPKFRNVKTDDETSRRTKNMVHVTRSVEVASRVTLEYVEQGDPNGIPVLLLHGITDSWHSFELVLPHLPESVRAIAVSQRGHGNSSRPSSGYLPRDFAADVAAFMNKLGIESAIIVGHSMGSYVAQRFAIDYPERTRGLVLIGSTPSLRGNAGVDEFRDSVSKLTDPIDKDFALEFQKSTMIRPVPQSFLDTVVRESLKAPARVWRAALEGLIEGDTSAELTKIKTPALIVWGERDAFFSLGDQEALNKAIKGSKLIRYANTGHAPHWEEPERFVSDLMAFINSLDQ